MQFLCCSKRRQRPNNYSPDNGAASSSFQSPQWCPAVAFPIVTRLWNSWQIEARSQACARLHLRLSPSHAPRKARGCWGSPVRRGHPLAARSSPWATRRCSFYTETYGINTFKLRGRCVKLRPTEPGLLDLTGHPPAERHQASFTSRPWLACGAQLCPLAGWTPWWTCWKWHI